VPHGITENSEFCQGPAELQYSVYRKKQCHVTVSQRYHNADNVFT